MVMKNPAKVFFEKVAIIGVGLMGGSLAISLRENGYAGTITGIGRGQKNLEAARKVGVINAYTTDIVDGVADADLVVVAVPVMKAAAVVKAALPALKPGAVVTDVGSVKEQLVRDMESMLPDDIHFVGGHPIAGTENSGSLAAFSGLFENRKCILTPTPKTDPSALALVRAIWESAGSEVVEMDARVHDVFLSAISHLPHMIAFTLVNTVAGIEAGGEKALGYSAGGFRDFTRIASSSPEMWADICSMNKGAILDMLRLFGEKLDHLMELIDGDDTERLKEEFEEAKTVRDSLKSSGHE